MQIHGFQKLTLLDYPGKVACTIFFGHCNFRCPFCHNGNLVLHPEQEPEISEDEIWTLLSKRRGVLDGVCVTGGEPTLEPELPLLLARIRAMGYLVKLDTNGYRPDVLKKLVADDLVDYVAMDIKNSPERYAETAGIANLDILKIQESVEFLLSDAVDYEFRTTITRELHGKEEMETIGRWLSGCKRYYLQNYRESDFVINPIFTGYSREQLERFAVELRKTIPVVGIRGVE